jgi:hypothetical protein
MGRRDGADSVMRTFPLHAGVGLGLVVVLLAGACGEDQTDAERAADLLQQGLRAHAAGNLGTAVADYRQVLVLDPQNKFAYYNIGLIDQTQGNDAASEQNYRTALVSTRTMFPPSSIWRSSRPTPGSLRRPSPSIAAPFRGTRASRQRT